MKRGGIHKNNRGDSLILVIGAIAMLSLLGIVILAKTMDNQTMKRAEEMAQQSFFEADSSSTELVTALETVAQDALEKAFSEMLLEYAITPDETARKNNFSKTFTTTVMNVFNDNYVSPSAPGTKKDDALEGLLRDALEVPSLTGLSVTYDGAAVEGTVSGSKTQTVRVRNVKLDYSADGSRTSITTDICINATFPNMLAGTQSGMACDFSDFTIITDGSTSIPDGANLTLNGNVYVGEDMLTGNGGSGSLTVSQADKMLVRKDLVIEDQANVMVYASGLTTGQGVWANGIWVKGGTLSTDGVNLYVADDLTIEADGSTVTFAGAGTEYVGYSGNVNAAHNHKKSSAITINSVKGITTLDLSGLGKLYVDGYSYIRDDNWDDSVDGVLQGETIAYKDMQAMYLVPGSCLTQGHNPIIGAVDPDMPGHIYTIEDDGSTVQMDLSQYIDTTSNLTKFKKRIAKLQGGTEATYAYLNFASPEQAAKYVQDYLASPMGQMIRNQIKNLGAGSTITLPANTLTAASAISYDGINLTVHPGADMLQKQILSARSTSVMEMYGSLFSSLRQGFGLAPVDGYKLLQENILAADAFDALTPNVPVEIMVADPAVSGTNYTFVAHKGDLTLTGTDPYLTLNGILLVDGTVTIQSNATINGLVLATGGVKIASGSTSITNNRNMVEVLLTDSNVAKYFKGYAGTSSGSYLSTEAVEISFESWERN